MSIFEQGAAMQVAAFNWGAELVAYFRGGTTVAAAIPAKLGRTLFRADDAYGVTVRTERRDFILRAEDISVTPEVGDIIQHAGHVYTVSAPNGEPCWRWHGRQDHGQIRVHAMEDGEVQA